MSPSTETIDWNPDDGEFAELVDRITQRLQNGEQIDESELASQHPQYAGRIRQLLPSLRLIGCADVTGPLGTQHLPEQGRQAKSEMFSVPGMLGDYQILRELGRGGMGVVYEAQQVSLNKRVALKILPFASMLDPRSVKRFENEARAAAQLQHPHIVSVHAVGRERGTHFYAMQYVEGTDLSHVIAELKVETSRRALDTTSAASNRQAERDTSRSPKASGRVQGEHTF